MLLVLAKERTTATKAMRHWNSIITGIRYFKDPDGPWHQEQIVIKLGTKRVICQNLATLM